MLPKQTNEHISLPRYVTVTTRKESRLSGWARLNVRLAPGKSALHVADISYEGSGIEFKFKF